MECGLMRVWVLGSGSRGNSVLLECGSSRVLVDAGFSVTAMSARLAAIDVAPESIEAVFVTHEHTDHAKGAAACARQWGWAVYASAGTAAQMPDLRGASVLTVGTGATLQLGRFDVQTVATSHDAVEPLAVIATSRATGARAGVVYDLGAVTATVRDAVRDLDVLVLEANHDEGMLRSGPYPASVRARIASRSGHLSNSAAARLARECAHRHLSELVLAHVSEVCNERPLAISTVRAALDGTRFRGHIHAAPQDAAMGPFTPRLRRGTGPTQFELAL
jgi:phosphoribosyl 1,2-cyclic phosphodiesterase